MKKFKKKFWSNFKLSPLHGVIRSRIGSKFLKTWIYYNYGKIIITGGDGAIASELLHHFRKEKNKIFLISNKNKKIKIRKKF